MGFDIMGNDGDEGNDSLGSSFASSFSIPPPAPKEVADKEVTHSTSEGGTAAEDAAAGQDPKGHAEKDPVESTSSGPAPDAAIDAETAKAEAKEEAAPGEDWKEALESNLVEWRKESSSARKKAEETRAKIEEERTAAVKATDNSAKEEQRRKKQEKEEAELEKRIQAALAAPGPSTSSARAHAKTQAKKEEKEQRWADVRDAWEIVKDGKSLAEGAEVVNEELAEQGVEKVEEVEVDGRGLTAGDEGGREGNKGQQMLADLQTATKAVTNHSSINPELAPDFEPKAGPALSQSDKPEQDGSGPAKSSAEQPSEAPGIESEEKAKSVESKQPSTASASTETSGKKEAADTSDYPSKLPAKLPKQKEKAVDHFDNSHPNELVPSPNPSSASQPPSLTLSLFTTPSRRTLLRVSAVLGINLFLPFVNGVMLGFGEIFAKEAFGFGRRWWTGQVKWTDLMRGSAVAGLGLQQAALETLP